MKKYLKLFAGVLALIGVAMMFFPQVVIKWGSYWGDEAIGIRALVGTYESPKTLSDYTMTGLPLAAYILLGVGAIILLVAALVPYFKEHDVLSAVVTGLAVICLIVSAIMIFLIRKNFAENVVVGPDIWVGWGAMVAGSCASLAAASGVLGIILDLANN